VAFPFVQLGLVRFDAKQLPGFTARMKTMLTVPSMADVVSLIFHPLRSSTSQVIRPPQTTGAARAPGSNLRVAPPDRSGLEGRGRCRAPRPG
jgi:hypothetical protein